MYQNKYSYIILGFILMLLISSLYSPTRHIYFAGGKETTTAASKKQTKEQVIAEIERDLNIKYLQSLINNAQDPSSIQVPDIIQHLLSSAYEIYFNISEQDIRKQLFSDIAIIMIQPNIRQKLNQSPTEALIDYLVKREQRKIAKTNPQTDISPKKIALEILAKCIYKIQTANPNISTAIEPKD